MADCCNVILVNVIVDMIIWYEIKYFKKLPWLTDFDWDIGLGTITRSICNVFSFSLLLMGERTFKICFLSQFYKVLWILYAYIYEAKPKPDTL